MSRLSTDHVLKEHQTRDANSITSLILSQKALSDVSCLIDFKNLEKLDLTFNSLSSLEGLKSCTNLKWLSVVQNKLHSLKGVEGLSKLTVLNAGKNKLKSMDDVQSLVGLRALILNDNEITTICRLEQLKDLNTLVLSRNPISELGESLHKVRAITKLSLSNCQIQLIGSSLKFCTELKELRLAHNDIKTIPEELSYNKKLQNLDLGNNLISRWSDLKVLGSFVGLKNLNLHGNPIAEKDKLTKKVRKLLPNLHVFNAKPIDKTSKNEKGDLADNVNDPSNKRKSRKEDKGDHIQLVDSNEDISGDILDKEKNSKRDASAVNKYGNLSDHGDTEMKKDSKRKMKKTTDKQTIEEVQKNDSSKTTKERKNKRSNEDPSELDVIDDAETSFQDLFNVKLKTNPKDYKETIVTEVAHQNKSSVGAFAGSSAKKKKSSHRITSTSHEVEVGLGGPSTWGDE